MRVIKLSDLLATIPDQYLLKDKAPAPRTLWDVVRDSAANNPEAAAIDDGDILTYAELIEDVEAWAAELRQHGVKRGDHIGIRMTSGQRDLYLAILATLAAGAAYVPVDADDPEERADMVFGEAGINGIFTDEGFRKLNPSTGTDQDEPHLDDTAWIIFTSGSTGKPKGVAVTHRSAAAFVDAEAALFLQDNPLGPEDRVLAGLSVAFDASCEEMWLAWGHGACLVPAPRSLVRSGMDLGPWLIRRDITVVSTVPTLAGLWPAEALDNVRLLIVGGEACSQELVNRLATEDREMWNTYGPTEATVVASAAMLKPDHPVSIGLPLNGWDLVVIDAEGNPVSPGEVGELVIGGVGLARYLDPEKDAEKYAPLPSVGWERAYRTGDHVRLEEDGLYFVGRVDDQVKIGGRRIELGEVEANVAALPNVYNSAVAVNKTAAGESVLVGYVSLEDPEVGFDHRAAKERLAETMPAALVPRICVMDELPIRTSGKVDKKALPWPLPGVGIEAVGLSETEEWLAQLFVDVLGVSVEDEDADFFTLGGTSLAAATLVGRIRERFPTVAVRDLYDHPRLGSLAETIDATAPEANQVTERNVKPVGVSTRLIQFLWQLPAMTLASTNWLAWLLFGSNIAAELGVDFAPQTPWAVVIAFLILFASPLGRIPIGALGARLLTAGITPGDYPRGGSVHLRIWAAERWADASGARSIAGATWVLTHARLLGVKVGKFVDLHSLPPVTGLLTLGDHAAIEPEVDLSGYWLDGDILRVGAIEVKEGARVGARSQLMPGSVIGEEAHIEAGSTVTGNKKVKAGARWAGSPAKKVGRSKHRFPDHSPARRSWWVPIYGATSMLLAAQPLVAIALAAFVIISLVQATDGNAFVGAVLFAPVGAIAAFAFYMVQTWLGVRILSIGIQPGVFPVRSARGWRLWAVERLMDDARTVLFPLYAGQLTPLWLRSLGATIGKDVEISTAVMVPKLTEVKDGAFLADDTLIGGYELGGGWMSSGLAKVGKRSFVGNSGITAPGRKLGKNSLVAVLSSTPKKAKAGTNWWGSPPERMRRVEASVGTGDSLTYNPPAWAKVARGVIETLRLLAPASSAMLLAAVLSAMVVLLNSVGLWLTWLLSGVILFAAGIIAMAITIVVKWVCVGKHKPADHPLWSSFVWLNELQDAFVETVAAPWFFNHAMGTAELNTSLRLLGVKIGRGAWIESYWFPETDLCYVGAGATVGPGTVVQTHLFQDRVMSLDTVTLDDGATLAAHSVSLPASHIHTSATVAPGSLVMRGDQVPGHTTWQGNPIEPMK
ncbi:MAG: amino acid adenylation domain-containing protein [Corynebacterium casei]|uniref:Pls/PosA family non-ribosomal peptide synthetase n=1 Tax=Corynebacterium casei TaxID=160386 RepID=UPI002649607E|nr:Pls/PosA family non-ribosomal peptide synthetase [Corynebacterium casei]MDN5798888.1 amino acid adenylation domain-containing protein [Corynebacterium casei]MDN5921329.1 amino acid adenylation domain-containing protein [Corynebacterium casei]MDN6272389.1 amino acid adenylation domain-containing protein [Corynebacterium casei]MDN6311606.1 amino acid adenylation domain-containing protein [Corynebacterium casei]MDN6339658.1 amino acid adenylation domain-containing protein [Corynebacterium case